MILFKALWVINAIISLIVLYFFFEGMTDNTISSSNIGLWLFILAVLAVIMVGSIWLRSRNHPSLALALLCALAIPAFLYLLFILIALFGGGRWN